MNEAVMDQQIPEKEFQRKFFKKNLKKLISAIKNEEGKPVEFNQSQWAMVYGLEEHRFWVHIAGRRTGKSFAAAVLAFAKLLENNSQVAVVAPNYALSSIIWDYLCNLIDQFGIEATRRSVKDRVITLPNGSTVRLLSVENRATLVGRGYHLVIVDEAAIIDSDEYFIRDIRPTLATYDNTRCLFISTPRGRHNYLHEYYERGLPINHNKYPEWGSGVFTWRSNPRLSKADIEEAQRSMSKVMFAQEYECSWTSFENMIYDVPETSKQHNVLESISKRKMTYIAGLDIGYRDKTAFIVIATDYNKYYIVDEFVVDHHTTSQLAKTIKKLNEKYEIQSIYIDSAAAQMKADLAMEHDIYCDSAIKDVSAGIAHLQNLIEKGDVILDIDRVPDTIAALEQYKWKTKGAKPVPDHDWTSHCADAVRYAIYSHQKTQVGIFVG